MSARTARQVGRVQLEQSDMRLATNMAKMCKCQFSHTTIHETQYRIKNPDAEVREQMEWCIELPGYQQFNAVIARHQAIVCQNLIAGCPPCENGTEKNLETCWPQKRTGVPLPTQCRQPTPEPPPEPLPEPTPLLPGTPPTMTSHTSGNSLSKTVNMPGRYSFLHTSLPSSKSVTLDVSAQDRQSDAEFDPEMMTDEGIATG